MILRLALLVSILLAPSALGQETEAPKKEKPSREVRYSTFAGQDALESDAELLDQAKAIEAAKVKCSLEDLKKTAESLSKLVENKATPWRRHFLGLVHYDIATMLDETEPEASAKHRDLAATQLEKALAEDEKLVESHAVLAICIAMKIDMSDPQSMMTLAIQAENHYQTGLALAPKNPILLMNYGVHKHFTPAEFGGGPKVSRPYFERALEQAPGFLEAQAWMAICLKDAGEKEAAKKIVDRLEKEHPGNAWIQGLLDAMYHEVF